MPQVKVTKIGKAKSGKPIAYFDNRHGQTDGFLVSDKCNIPQEGMTINADTASWDYRGTTYWGLNSWKLVEASPQANQFHEPPNRGNGQSAVVDLPMNGWNIQDGDLSRYASNIVASAITAGLIKDPADVRLWAKAAYRSGQALREGFTDSGPDPQDDHGYDEETIDPDRVPF